MIFHWLQAEVLTMIRVILATIAAAAIAGFTLTSLARAFYTECTVIKDTQLSIRPDGPTEPRYAPINEGDKVAFRNRYQKWWFVLPL